MAESKVLHNVPYTIHNYSNYSIVAEETRDIVDVPYFPAQNLVDVSGAINPYVPAADCYIPFYDSNNTHRLFAVLNRTDARILFVEFADDARYVKYQFVGNSYPQGREMYTYSYTKDEFILFGGFANGRCMDDLWVYGIDTNKWENINYSETELGANQVPTRRRKSSIVAYPSEIWMFGGETDVLKINTELEDSFFIPLNDVWYYDRNTEIWNNFDPNRILPHRTGHIVHVDASAVTILITGGINEIGINEPTALWTIDRTTHNVSSTAFSGPFQPSIANTCFLLDGKVHIQVQGKVYRWEHATTEFVLVTDNTVGISAHDGSYWIIDDVEVHYGAHAGMDSTEIHNALLYDVSDTLQSTKTITLPPKGINIPNINADDVLTFFYGGMYGSGESVMFNESVFIMNHTTLNVAKYDFPEDTKPTERVFPSLAYDKYRGRIWLFGGFDGTRFYNDLWYFDLGLKTWTKVYDQTITEGGENYPSPRQKSGICIVETHFLYLIGGYSDINAFNDFWKYDINQDSWQKVYAADTIPWGSQYFIFEWRDRLWYYNGQQLYRWFHQVQQFKAQPFLIADTTTSSESSSSGVDDPIAEVIAKKQFLDSPINMTVINDYMFVQNPSFSFSCELETKVVTNYVEEFDMPTTQIQWMDRYWGIIVESLEAVYINVSPLQSLTKNQVPHSFFYKSLLSPIPDGMFYVDDDTIGGSRLAYQDNNGLFKLLDAVIPLEKGELLVDEKIAFTATQSEYPEVDFENTEGMLNKVIETLAQPTTYPYAPWFQYSKFKPISSFYDGMVKNFYNERTKRIYALYKNGNILKINPADNTFFAYFTQIWEGAAVGYNKLTNKIYAFGGLRGAPEGNSGDGRIPYSQNGMECSAPPIEGVSEQSHCGLMEFDLNLNDMNLGSIQNYLRERKMSSVDYSVTREYLVDLVAHYIEGYANNTIPNSIEDVKEKVYMAVQPLVDDLSQFDFVFEHGVRPCGRAYAFDAQVGDRLYVFGGCDSYTVDCSPIQSFTPYLTAKPGTIVNMASDEDVFDSAYEGIHGCYFDMSTKTWHDVSPINKWKYLGSSIVDPAQNRFIYLVGGFEGANCTLPSRDILIYDTQNDTYEQILNVPKNYVGRAKPMLHWMDDDRLLIMYGFYTYNSCVSCEPCTCCTYYHIPIGDAWILDRRKHIMYEAWRDLNGYSGLVVKDTFYIDEPTDNDVYILSVAPEIDTVTQNPIIRAFKWNLVNGEVYPQKIIPTQEIIDDYNGFNFLSNESKIENATAEGDMSVEAMPGGGAPKLSLEEIFLSSFKNSNFRFRYAWMEQYGAYKHQHMFVIGERSDKSGIKALEDMARGHTEAHLRFWYVDMEAPEQFRFMHNVPYEYPLPLAPVAVSYDGSRYIYCIYNKYNIWRLDFKNVLLDPSGTWWHQCPPCLDCNFLGDSRTEETWDTFYMPPKYLTLFSSGGRMARMDTNTFVWFLDKKEEPVSPVKGIELTSASEIDSNEAYLYALGGMAGKVMNVYERQWDNFFFDMRVTNDVVKNFKDAVSDKLWPVMLRRKRLYTINHLGHVFYSWLRINGKYDVEFQLNDFYQGNEIRLYGDYTFLQNWDQAQVSIFDINGNWINIDHLHFTQVTNESGWDWDGQFSRQYVRMFVSTDGIIRYQYSKVPPNYVSIDMLAAMGADRPISKIRVKYQNVPEAYNYMSRINRVEMITDQEIVASYESELATTPLSIIHIDPVNKEDDFSNEFAVFIKNTGSETAKDVQAYVYDNDWVQFNLDPANTPDAWTIRDQNTPFTLVSELPPGGHVILYIRAVNIDSRPHIKDLVVKGIYPYSA